MISEIDPKVREVQVVKLKVGQKDDYTDNIENIYLSVKALQAKLIEVANKLNEVIAKVNTL